MTRRLRCTRCRDHILVTEVPAGWIDPKRFVCGQCNQPAPPPAAQLELAGGERREQPAYDPAMAALPEGF